MSFRITCMLCSLLLLPVLSHAAADAVRVGGDLKVNGITFGDNSTLGTAQGLMKNRGAWSGSALYSVGDVVQYGGVSYTTINANTEVKPSNDNKYWALLAPQGPVGPAGPAGPQGVPGPQGPMGAGVNWRGPFDHLAAAYSIADVVQYEGKSWIASAAIPQACEAYHPISRQCIVPGLGWVAPGSAEGVAWQLFASGGVGPQGPQGAQGATGPIGAQGLQGLVGPQGPQGPAGPVALPPVVSADSVSFRSMPFSTNSDWRPVDVLGIDLPKGRHMLMVTLDVSNAANFALQDNRRRGGCYVDDGNPYPHGFNFSLQGDGDSQTVGFTALVGLSSAGKIMLRCSVREWLYDKATAGTDSKVKIFAGAIALQVGGSLY